jgi:hyperosmotically inducible protein
MKTLFVLILLIALAAGGYWYLNNGHAPKAELQNAEDQITQRAHEVGDTVRDKLKDFSLSNPEIKDELERSGKVVRKKAEQVGAAIADATADARITATIKAKLVKDQALSALRISVNTTAGVVTLSGSAAGTDEIKQAMKLAYDTEGVREVVSTLQVKTTK